MGGVIGGGIGLCGVMLAVTGASCWLSKRGGAVELLGGRVALLICRTGLWCW